MNEIVGVVLAAGAARRMGSTKQLLDVGGTTMLQVVLDTVASVLPRTVVVLGAEAGRVAATLRIPDGAEVVVNPDHAEGQASSLARAVEAAPDAVALLVALGDQPELRADAVRAVAAAATEAQAVRASYGGRPGHPVGLRRDLFPRILGLTGDRGARALWADGSPPRAVEVGGEPPPDIDTPEDHRRLLVRRGAARGRRASE